jgi:murein DD-endopeptidase MepM/ murein hydrolase activator NlpD
MLRRCSSGFVLSVVVFMWGSVMLAGVTLAGPEAVPSRGATEAAPLRPPVVPACVSSPFGPRVLANKPLAGTFHKGIDLPAPVGSPVFAVAPGKVIRVQRHGVGGLEILIQHAGFIGVYSHLGLIVPVLAEGAKTVFEGERIATIGRSGLGYGPHLYFGMIVDGRTVDPAPYLNVGPCGSGSAGTVGFLGRPAQLLAKH